MINTVCLCGRVCSNAELKYTSTQMAICTFSVAINERVKDATLPTGYGERPNYFDCVLYGNYGKALQPNLTKGREVTLNGRLHQDRWEKNNQKYSRVIVVIDDIVVQREPVKNLQTPAIETQPMSVTTSIDPAFVSQEESESCPF